MRLTTLFLIMNLLQVSAIGFSQNSRLDINMTNATIKEVLGVIENQSSFKFVYRDEDVENKKVSLKSEGKSIDEVLTSLLSNTGTIYRILDNNLVVIAPIQSLQQNVSGRITDASTTEALVGVNVIVEGTNIGTVTDADGKFTLDIPGSKAVLVCTYLGYVSEKVQFTGQSTLEIKLVQEITKLEEVVVVGYGTVKKKDLTGAVTVVNAESIQRRSATTIAEAMQGLVSGVYIRGGSQAGSETTFEIRGTKSLAGDNKPLYIIDGLPTNGGRDLNPNDIESIQILKDASAAAIYGVQASNGVIIITTKKGKPGPMKIDFSAKKTYQWLPRYDLMETNEFAYWNNMAYDNAGQSKEKLNMDVNTNWQNEAFRTGVIDDVNLGVSGGDKYGNYLISGGYFGNKGDIIGTGFNRYSLRINTEGTRGIIKVGESMQANTGYEDRMSGNPVIDVVRMLPTIPLLDPTHPGGYGYGNEATSRTFGTNPVAHTDLEHAIQENFRVRGALWSEVTIFPFLKYKLNLGYETSNDHYKYLRKKGSWTLNQPEDNSKLNENRARYTRTLIENTLTFDKKFDKHSLNLLVGQSYTDEQYEMIWGEKQNIIRDTQGTYYTILDDGTSNLNTGGYQNHGRFLSYFGRFNYSFDDKYIVTGIVRTDGTSRVDPSNHWGTFPSGSVAWRISKEEFLKSIEWIDDLKLRANYGKVGSMGIGYWDYQYKINVFPQAVFGRDQHVESGATNVQLANKDIKWETSTQKNFGIDATLFKRITLSAEYFIANNDNILYGMPIPMFTGNDGGNPYVNSASIENRGIEITATYRNEENPFKYSVTGNYTQLRNKLTKLGGYGQNPTVTAITKSAVGDPIGRWYLIKSDGIFTEQPQIDNYKNKDGKVIQPNAKPGDMKYIDYDQDGQITGNDRQLGDSPWPKFEGNLTVNSSYKNIDFSMTWFGSYGAKVFNSLRTITDRMDDNSNYRKEIVPYIDNNHSYNAPRPYFGSTDNARFETDRWLENGSFTRLKFITLGYTLPSSLLGKMKFESCRISVTGQNLLTFTKYTGLDPEFPPTDVYQRGRDPLGVPNARMLSVALQFRF